MINLSASAELGKNPAFDQNISKKRLSIKKIDTFCKNYLQSTKVKKSHLPNYVHITIKGTHFGITTQSLLILKWKRRNNMKRA